MSTTYKDVWGEKEPESSESIMAGLHESHQRRLAEDQAAPSFVGMTDKGRAVVRDSEGGMPRLRTQEEYQQSRSDQARFGSMLNEQDEANRGDGNLNPRELMQVQRSVLDRYRAGLITPQTAMAALAAIDGKLVPNLDAIESDPPALSHAQRLAQRRAIVTEHKAGLLDQEQAQHELAGLRSAEPEPLRATERPSTPSRRRWPWIAATGGILSVLALVGAIGVLGATITLVVAALALGTPLWLIGRRAQKR